MIPPRYFQMLVSPHVGGGARLAIQLHAHAIAEMGAVSHLLLPGGGEAERSAVQAKFPYTRYRVDRLSSASRVVSLLENARLFARMPRKSGAVVHVHAPFVYGAARPFFAAARARTLLHVHLDFTAEQLSWALRKPPDTVIVCAEFMLDAVQQALPPGSPTRVRVIRNAIDTRQFAPSSLDPVVRASAKRALGAREDRPLLMLIANLAPHKGQDTAVRAIAQLRDLGQDASLWLVGAERAEGADYLASLQTLVRELQVEDRVTFAGFRNDVPRLLRAADMVLLPSTSEGLPLTILEAQAAGAVVLAAPTAGIPEVVESGRTGFLIAAHDAPGYAARIDELLRRPELARELITAARRHVCEHHDLRSYGDKLLGEYQRLASAPGKA